MRTGHIAYSGTAGELGAVYLEGRGLPRKVRALIDEDDWIFE